MKTLAFLFTGAAALALSACGSADDTADEAADVTVVEDAGAAPVATETTVVRDADGTDGSAPDRVTVGPDGVSVDVDSNGTRVQADSEGGSVTVSD